jgi:hypothetical protein
MSRNDDSNPTKVIESRDDSPQTRSSERRWRTIGGRAFLVALVVVLVVELHAKICYDRSLDRVTSLTSHPLENNRDPSLDEVVGALSGFPTKQRKFSFQQPVLVVQWPSLFKDYIIELQLGQQDSVAGLQTAGKIKSNYTDEPVSQFPKPSKFRKSVKRGGGLSFQPGIPENDRSVVQLVALSLDTRGSGLRNGDRPLCVGMAIC